MQEYTLELIATSINQQGVKLKSRPNGQLIKVRNVHLPKASVPDDAVPSLCTIIRAFFFFFGGGKGLSCCDSFCSCSTVMRAPSLWLVSLNSSLVLCGSGGEGAVTPSSIFMALSPSRKFIVPAEHCLRARPFALESQVEHDRVRSPTSMDG